MNVYLVLQRRLFSNHFQMSLFQGMVLDLGSPGMVVLWCVAHETHERQSWDGGSYCGVWPLRPMSGSPGMVGVTVVCGP